MFLSLVRRIFSAPPALTHSLNGSHFNFTRNLPMIRLPVYDAGYVIRANAVFGRGSEATARLTTPCRCRRSPPLVLTLDRLQHSVLFPRQIQPDSAAPGGDRLFECPVRGGVGETAAAMDCFVDLSLIVEGILFRFESCRPTFPMIKRPPTSVAVKLNPGEMKPPCSRPGQRQGALIETS